ncbi:hypothetical protein Hte_009263 [Hypoxylon texense]
MDSFDRLNHLTRPAVQNLPRLEHQPPAFNTRYVIKSEGGASVKASDQETQTKTWFKSPPLTAQTIRLIRAVKLFAESHDQGFVDKLNQGNWTWIQLAIFDNDEATSPRKGRDGQELVVISHSNDVNSKQYKWLQGETFDTSRSFLKLLEAGNVIAVRLCARYGSWEISADNGYLVIDIGDDNNPVPIIPIQINSDDPVPHRRNVEAWYEEVKTSHKTGLELSLFIRAMKNFQLLPPEDQLSYYRIAGIHGYPYNVSWNMGKEPIPLDDKDIDNKVKNGQGGYYCEHSTYLFPTWHRAYMMLFERRISDLMMEEAATRAKETEEWVLAAKRWRLPYWDWASKPRLPDLARDEKISIIKSWNGQAQAQPLVEELDNPMYRFQMPGLQPMGDVTYGNYRISNQGAVPWEKCKGTSRHAISITDPTRRWVDGYSDAKEVDRSLQGAHSELSNRTLKDAVFRLLTYEYTTKYVHFATDKYDPKSLKNAPGDKAKGYLNLEQIHNSVHDLTGSGDTGYGHMSAVAVAAFDPVFWLHHCNIDRLLHLWQCSNPGNWFHKKRGQSVDETLQKGSPQKALIPFHSSSKVNDFYNSNMVRDVDALNYTYDYMEEVTDEFGDMIPEKSHLYINKLYGPPKSAYEYRREELDPVINVIYNRHALGGRPYSLLFFLGAVDHEVPYRRQKNLVGSIFTFSTTLVEGATTCKNCYEQQRDKVLSRAQVPLTRVVPIENRQKPEEAMEYFKTNLKWIAVLATGEVVERGSLADLDITLLIGKNQLRGDLGKDGFGRENLFKFDDYQKQEFDWDGSYASN